jgi:hypothetical protein
MPNYLATKCPHCSEPLDVDRDEFAGDGDSFLCESCLETVHLVGDRVVTPDDWHEIHCDSRAAADYEDRAYGPADSWD